MIILYFQKGLRQHCGNGGGGRERRQGAAGTLLQQCEWKVIKIGISIVSRSR